MLAIGELMNKAEFAAASESGSYLQIFLYKVPKKDYDAISQNQKQFVQWFNKHGIQTEYYRLGSSETMEGVDSISNTLSVAEDEDLWMELDYFRNPGYFNEICATMKQDPSSGPLVKQIEDLVIGSKMITGGFRHLKV